MLSSLIDVKRYKETKRKLFKREYTGTFQVEKKAKNFSQQRNGIRSALVASPNLMVFNKKRKGKKNCICIIKVPFLR